jgi:hypothetical protein
MKKAYMVQNKVFFDAEQVSEYLLNYVHTWKQEGCIGDLSFPRVLLGTYGVHPNCCGGVSEVFVEDKTGKCYGL